MTMIRIDPHSLYSRSDLIEMLEPIGIDADGWVARLKPVKRFRFAWWGEDIIEAIQSAPALGEVEEKTAQSTRARRRKGAQIEDIEELKRIQRGE